MEEFTNKRVERMILFIDRVREEKEEEMKDISKPFQDMKVEFDLKKNKPQTK